MDEPATGELTPVLVVVVGVEPVELVVVRQVPVRVAVTDGELFHLRSIGIAAKDRTGPQHGGSTAIGALDIVIVVARGDVELAIIANRQPGDLVVMKPTKPLSDDFAEVPRPAGPRLTIPPDRAAPRGVEPAVVE